MLKSEMVSAAEKPVPKFPKLMKSIEAGYVVLFSSPEHGIVVYSPLVSPAIGHNSTHWRMDKFQDFYGTITLTSSF